MTNCTPLPLQFSPLKRKKVEANFTGGNITSDAGLLLLREIDKRLKLTHQMSQVIQDNRHSGYVTHSVKQMIKQRIYGISSGYEDVNDQDTLRQDPFFQMMIGREAPLASSATLSRFENSIDRNSLVKLSQLFVEQFIKNHEKAPQELILDFDPTDHEIHGHQEKRHFHGYYKHDCFLPLHVFCGSHLLVSLLRPSYIDGAKYAGPILRLLVKRIRQTWPNTKIIFRGDCAFARKRILYWCENNKVDYVVGMPSNSRLQSLASELTDQAKKQYADTKTKQRLFSDYRYKAATWKRERRIIAKAECHRKEQAAKQLYDGKYCPRGDMENKIKQLKFDFYSDRNSCSNFLANQFRLLLSSAAYILVSELQRMHLSKTQFKKSYCRTIRVKLFKIGAIVLQNTRRIQILLSSGCPYQTEFNMAAQSLVPI